MESSGQIPFPVRVRERAQRRYQSAGSLGDNLARGRLDADDDGGRLLAVVPGNLLGSALGAPSFCVAASAAALGRAAEARRRHTRSRRSAPHGSDGGRPTRELQPGGSVPAAIRPSNQLPLTVGTAGERRRRRRETTTFQTRAAGRESGSLRRGRRRFCLRLPSGESTRGEAMWRRPSA